MTIKYDKFEEQIFFNTILIQNLTDNEMGTGFLVRKEINEKEQRILLFSNKHVFWGKKDINKQDTQKEILLFIHKKNDDNKYELGNVQKVKLTLNRKDEGYVDHPDDTVDVGCVNLSGLYDQIKVHMRSISDDFFDFDYENITSGRQVYFVGYPSGFFDKKHILPIMRSGTISSIPSIDFNGKPQMLIDAQVYPGSSGSPVFTVIKGQYRLIGILSEAALKKIDYVAIQKPATTEEKDETVPVEFIGLGIMYKVDAIKKLIDLS